MPLSALATEIAANHYSVRSSITDEQWAVLRREKLAESHGNFNHRSLRENLDASFEREAAAQSHGH